MREFRTSVLCTSFMKASLRNRCSHTFPPKSSSFKSICGSFRWPFTWNESVFMGSMCMLPPNFDTPSYASPSIPRFLLESKTLVVMNKVGPILWPQSYCKLYQRRAFGSIEVVKQAGEVLVRTFFQVSKVDVMEFFKVCFIPPKG